MASSVSRHGLQWLLRTRVIVSHKKTPLTFLYPPASVGSWRSVVAASTLQTRGELLRSDLNHNFFSTKADLRDETLTVKNETEPQKDSAGTGLATALSDPESETQELPLNALDTLPVGYTAGKALQVLQQKGAGGTKISEDAVRALFEACAPNSPKDAKIIYTALRNFKRINDFVLETSMAELAIQQMKQSLNDGGDLNVKELLFIFKVVRDQSTGMYCAASVDVMNNLLSELLEASRRETLRVKPVLEGGEGESTQEEGRKELKGDEGLAEQVVSVTRDFVNLMIHRATPRKLTKRKKRARSKYMKTPKGPTIGSIQLAVDICLEVGDVDSAKRLIRRCGYTRFKPCPETEKQVQEMKAVEVTAATMEMTATTAGDDNEKYETDGEMDSETVVNINDEDESLDPAAGSQDEETKN